jgi:hypothetical protein
MRGAASGTAAREQKVSKNPSVDPQLPLQLSRLLGVQSARRRMLRAAVGRETSSRVGMP